MKDWLVPTILTLLAWGFWAFLPKIVIRYIDPNSAFVYQALGGVLVGLGVLITMKFKVQFNIPGFSIGLLIGLLGFIGAFLYLWAVSKGPLALVAPITAMYPMFAILLSLIFLNEAVSPRQGVGIALSVVAIYLIST
jgi:bacterial/archaeal transporter family protein